MPLFSYGRYILVVAAVIFVLELLAGAHRRVYRKEDLLIAIGTLVISYGAASTLAAVLIAGTFSLLMPAHRGALASVSLLPAALGVMVAGDLAFYWGHRLAHKTMKTRFDWLWMLHRTHHTGKFMNVTVTTRLNPFWMFVVPTAWVAGLAAYLGQPAAAGIALFVTFAWNLVTHSHFRWDDSLRRHWATRHAMLALDHLIITPGLHHTHHGFGRDGANYRNFAVMFAWIDWMFGTLHIPKGRPAHYGLPGSHPHWAEELLYPLVRVKARPDAG